MNIRFQKKLLLSLFCFSFSYCPSHDQIISTPVITRWIETLTQRGRRRRLNSVNSTPSFPDSVFPFLIFPLFFIAHFRWEGCQATDHCSRQCFNICRHKNHWISLMRRWEIFHLCLWQGDHIILTRCQSNFQPHLWGQNQVFEAEINLFLTLTQTISTHTLNRKIQRKEWKNTENKRSISHRSQHDASGGETSTCLQQPFLSCTVDRSSSEMKTNTGSSRVADLMSS